jgi:hypothetical protein
MGDAKSRSSREFGGNSGKKPSHLPFPDELTTPYYFQQAVGDGLLAMEGIPLSVAVGFAYVFSDITGRYGWKPIPGHRETGYLHVLAIFCYGT